MIRCASSGDLVLAIGKAPPQDILVDSTIICQSSRVFQKMLSGNFAEAKPLRGQWRVSLPADDAESVAIVMYIAHSRNERVPERPRQSLLHNILVVINKYEMAKILRPFAKKWCDSLVHADWKYGLGSEDLVFMMWELGHGKMFCEISLSIAWNYPVDSNDDLVDANGRPLKDLAYFDISNVLGLHPCFPTPYLRPLILLRKFDKLAPTML